MQKKPSFFEGWQGITRYLLREKAKRQSRAGWAGQRIRQGKREMPKRGGAGKKKRAARKTPPGGRQAERSKGAACRKRLGISSVRRPKAEPQKTKTLRILKKKKCSVPLNGAWGSKKPYHTELRERGTRASRGER